MKFMKFTSQATFPVQVKKLFVVIENDIHPKILRIARMENDLIRASHTWEQGKGYQPAAVVVLQLAYSRYLNQVIRPTPE